MIAEHVVLPTAEDLRQARARLRELAVDRAVLEGLRRYTEGTILSPRAMGLFISLAARHGPVLIDPELRGHIVDAWNWR